jgi:hypothetical protein
MTNLIDAATAARWTRRARRGALSKLRSLLEFRDMVEDFRAENVLMQAYSEAAVIMVCSADTLRGDMANIRDYSEADLVRWITNKVSFDHMEKAHELAELAHKTPMQLLNECIDPGNAVGDTMTVRELQSFALGEQKIHPAVYRWNVIFPRLCNFPTQLQWNDEKSRRWQLWIDEGKEFFKEAQDEK